MRLRDPLLLALLALAAAPALAHRPRLVDPSAAVVVVDEPDVSKAYFGTLRGRPQTYVVEWNAAVPFYVGLTVPAVPGAGTHVTATLVDADATVLARLDGEHARWTPFFESSARQRYLKGPEVRRELPPGRYEIRVESSAPEQDYALAIGERESFPPAELARDFSLLPKITARYFKQPAYTAFLTPFLGIPVLAVLALLAGATAFAVRWRHRHAAHTPARRRTG